MRYLILAVMICAGVIGCGPSAEEEFEKGNVNLELEKDDEAIADYTEAIRLNPEYAAAYYNRGVVYEKQGKQAEADADYAKAEELLGLR